jgi:3-phenylpropionate/trans-cinnamate dioxygenase ferredoxin subunit
MSAAFEMAANLSELPEGGQILVTLKGKRILICRSDDQLFAVSSQCTHDSEGLAGGSIRKCTIVCPIHGARFSLKTGMPFGPPAFEPLDTYPIRVNGDAIEVCPSENGVGCGST